MYFITSAVFNSRCKPIFAGIHYAQIAFIINLLFLPFPFLPFAAMVAARLLSVLPLPVATAAPFPIAAAAFPAAAPPNNFSFPTTPLVTLAPFSVAAPSMILEKLSVRSWTPVTKSCSSNSLYMRELQKTESYIGLTSGHH